MTSGLKVASSRNSSADWLELPDTYTKIYLPVGKEHHQSENIGISWKNLGQDQ